MQGTDTSYHTSKKWYNCHSYTHFLTPGCLKFILWITTMYYSECINQYALTLT